VSFHCKDCVYLHNAGHPKDSPLAPRYNRWCMRYGASALGKVGHCKLNKGKVLKRSSP